jgi:hypothetical protein
MGACLVAATGCGISPGDYIVYRVNVGEQSESSGCYYPEEEPSPDLADDSDSFRASQTWVVYYAAGDEIMLDAVGTALRGEETGDGFEFVADQIDVTYAGIDQQEARIAAQTRITITMNTDGDAVDGEIVSLTKTSCDFLTAAPSPGICEDIPDCTRTSPFSGVKLEDVRLEEGVDRPNDEIGGGVPPSPGPGQPEPQPDPQPGS